MSNLRHECEPDDEKSLTIAELEAELLAASSSAMFVPKYIIWRAIKSRTASQVGTYVSHDNCYSIARDKLFALLDPDELSQEDRRRMGRWAYLIARPSPEELAELTPQQARFYVWRNLFHAIVHGVLESAVEDGKLSRPAVLSRINAIGQVEFDEARHVLRQERCILPPGDDVDVYIEFVAVYLELKFFEPDQLRRYFPTIISPQHVEEILAMDVDFRACLQISRPSGVWLEEPSQVPVSPPPIDRPPSPSARKTNRLLRLAKKADVKGNIVRAAIMTMKASRFAVKSEQDALRSAAVAKLQCLAGRLGAVLDLSDEQTAKWRSALTLLLTPASRGFWPSAAKLLYELQKACVTHEKELFSLDLVEWVLRRFRGPLRRQLPVKRMVMVVRHFRTVAGRIESVRVDDASRRELCELTSQALEIREGMLRQSLTVPLRAALIEVGISPDNHAEKVSLDKMADELIDRVVERGYLTIGDLRDELSRSNLKLPDVRSPGDFIRGPLLMLDRRLPDILDAAYHRAEFYICSLMRISAAAFGTSVGRFATRLIVLPLLGAYVCLVGISHLINLILEFSGGPELVLMTSWSFACAAVYIAVLVNIPACRRASLIAVRAFGRSLRWCLLTLPMLICRHRIVRAIVASWPVRMLQNFIVKPALIAGAAWLVARIKYSDQQSLRNICVTVFVAAAVLLNCRAGRRLQEFTADWMLRTWRIIHANIVVGFLTWIWEAFKLAMESMERLFYAVDQYFRFRSGAGKLAMIVKPILGVVWFFVSYIFRMFINVFVEPQINPIKHFPVVTVSHKILLTYEPAFAELMISAGVSKYTAHSTATGIIGSIPGLFGFLVWELMGNWRIFESNRRPDLSPIAIGSHGESMIRFMKPGFHSGTLPKLFGRMRRASRRWSGEIRSARLGKYRRSIRHVEENISQFVRRELLALLDGNAIWGGLKIEPGRLMVGTKRVSMELLCPEFPSTSQWIFFEEQSGWLLADVSAGWVDSLSPDRRRIFALALAGWFKLAGVDIVRRQVERAISAMEANYDISDDGLVVWPDAKSAQATSPFATEVVYRFDRGKISLPQLRAGDVSGRELLTLDLNRLLFVRQKFKWSQWVALWQAASIEELDRLDLPAGLNVLDR